jgi:hypothetical protein
MKLLNQFESNNIFYAVFDQMYKAKIEAIRERHITYISL